jgi:hypothetical protein
VTGGVTRWFDGRMDNIGLRDAAVANNASWCDAVCRSHGHWGTFGPRVWSSPLHRLRYYPHAISLRPEATEAEVLANAAPSQPFAVKDSFARLDLAPAGLRLLVEANWIGRDGGPDEAPDDDGLSWRTVTSPGELSDWETAWAGDGGDGPVFRPDLLSDPRCAVLACRKGDEIVAGAIGYVADGAAGISNLFSAGLPLDRVWVGARAAVTGLHPDLPLVGWEAGESLEAARQAGFRVLGELRVWV